MTRSRRRSASSLSPSARSTSSAASWSPTGCLACLSASPSWRLKKAPRSPSPPRARPPRPRALRAPRPEPPVLTVTLAALAPDSDFVRAAYIVAFVLFIVGVRQGTHPSTAKRGNMIAAAGMAVAVATTLALDGIGNWPLIIGGILVGTAVRAVASIRVAITAMPQIVALTTVSAAARWR